MDDRDWQILSLLYKYKNITKTAKALYVSQPALTGRIKQIESELGVNLLKRSNKGVTFTPHGAYAAEFANRLLGEIAAFKVGLSSMGEEVAGIVRIGATSIMARYYLPALLEGFKQQHPLVRFDISIQTSSELLKLLKTNFIDFGIVKHCNGFSNGAKQLLTSYKVVIANVREFDIKQLPELPQVSYRYEEQYYLLLKQWWEENFSRQPKYSSKVANLDMCKEMIFSGLGYGFLPEIIVPESPVPLYTQNMYFANGTPFVRNTWLAYKQETLQNPVAKEFYDFVLEHDFASFLRARNK